jgi:hypothetical protein
MFADVLETVSEKGVIVVVASADDIAAANEERPGLLQVKKVHITFSSKSQAWRKSSGDFSLGCSTGLAPSFQQ